MKLAFGKNPIVILHLTGGFPKNKNMKIFQSKVNEIHLQRHRLSNNRKNFIQNFVRKLLCVRTRPELGEPGVVLKSRDDADKVSLLQVLEVCEAELVGVVGEVDGVHVPGDLFPVGEVVIVAVAGILCRKPTTGTLRMNWMKRTSLNAPPYTKERWRWKLPFKRWRILF